MEKCTSTIEQGDDSGWTPLHIAAHIGSQKFVKLLLEKGNSPAYLRNKEGLPAFHIAAKEGNCKVEFIQSFCWLYSVSNLLIIQHLETLYLGGNHVRVVCEKV